MIRYFILYITLALSRGILLGGASLTRWHSCFPSVTVLTVQPTSNNLIAQDEVKLEEVEIRPKLNASKTLDRTHLDLKLLLPRNIAAALPCHPPRLPQALQVIGVAAVTRMPTEGYVTPQNLIEKDLANGRMHTAQAYLANQCAVELTHNHLLRLRQNVTGCSLVSAASLKLKCPVQSRQQACQSPSSTGCHLRTAGDASS